MSGLTIIYFSGSDANKLEVVEPQSSSLLQGIANTMAAAIGVIGKDNQWLSAHLIRVAVPVAASLYVRFESWVPVFVNIMIAYTVGAVMFLRNAKAEPVM